MENFIKHLYHLSGLTVTEPVKDWEDLVRSEILIEFSKDNSVVPIGSMDFQSAPSHPGFRRELKLRKATINFGMAIRPSVRPPSWNNSSPNGRISIKLIFQNL